MVPCQALRLLIYVVLRNKYRRDRPTWSTDGVSVDGEGIGVFARTPASHTHVYACHTFNIRTCVYVRIIMYVH